MRIFLITSLLIFLFAPQSYAQKQFGIFSPEVALVTATYEEIYRFNEDYVEVHLGKELSYDQFYNRHHNTIHQYSITAKFVDGDTWMESCLLLPELGKWSIIKVEIIKSTNEYVLARDTNFLLKCEVYNSADIIYSKYTPLQGVFKIEYKGNTYISSNWNSEHYGTRPSTENLQHMRFSRESLFKKLLQDKKLEIFIVRDSNDGVPERLIDCHDDLFFYHNDNVKRNNQADFTCFIVPRIFFIKFEESSFSFDIMDKHSPIRFTIIVQQFETPEKTIWNYHRLEIVRKQSAHEIQINDLGPLPRAEWEPGWPDPATTPLWVEPKSECAQCQ